MIVAQQMAQAMDEQEEQLVVEGALFAPGGGFDRNHDITEHSGIVLRKREHVGGLVDIAPALIERANGRVAAQHDREIGAAHAGCGKGAGGTRSQAHVGASRQEYARLDGDGDHHTPPTKSSVKSSSACCEGSTEKCAR
jgi:hypothetical protein